MKGIIRIIKNSKLFNILAKNEISMKGDFAKAYAKKFNHVNKLHVKHVTDLVDAQVKAAAKREGVTQKAIYSDIITVLNDSNEWGVHVVKAAAKRAAKNEAGDDEQE